MKTTIRIISILCVFAFVAACAPTAPEARVKTAVDTKYKPTGK
jgi:hypothetical protein